MTAYRFQEDELTHSPADLDGESDMLDLRERYDRKMKRFKKD